jgi:hypothetical protein
MHRVNSERLYHSGVVVFLILCFSGFFDHVAPPHGVPPPSATSPKPGKATDYTRLGIRVPTIAVSPLIPARTLVSAPPRRQKPAPNSEYDHTSIMATVRKLLGVPSTPLTARDGWSATFEHILSLPSPRGDIPMQAPAPPPPSIMRHALAHAPINDLHKRVLATLSILAPEVVQQGEVREQHEFGGVAQRALEHHRMRMRHHHLARSAWRVVVQPPAFHAKETQFLWTNSSVVAERIIVNGTVRTCLDVDHVVEGAPIVLSTCAAWDAGQQWKWNNDGSISLLHAPEFCLGTPIADHTKYGVQPAILARCGDSVNVHWATVREGGGSTRTTQEVSKWIFYFTNAAVLAIVSA